MSTIFFFLSLLFGWMAWNLYHPNYDSKRFSLWSFGFGVVTGELAPHVIFWQVLTVAFFIMIGAVWGFFGALGFLICISAWGAMSYFYYGGYRAEKAVEQVLRAGLGESYQSEINEDFVKQFGTEPDQNLIRHPFRHRDPDVEMIRNIPFGDFGQKLDLRYPRHRDGESPKPVLFQIHGGGWTVGRKDDGQAIPLMNHMAKRGWICVATSYRLSPSATFPDHIVDCKQALVWIKEHITDYGGDPNFIVVTGGSAGGHLSSLVALSDGFAEFQPGFEDKDTSVQAAVPFYGIYDFTDESNHYPHEGVLELLEESMMKLSLHTSEDAYRKASPLHHVSERAPHMFVIQGEKDSLVPVAGAPEFVEKLKDVSKNKVVYLQLEDAQHAFDVLPSPRSEYVKFGVERFLAWTYSQYLKSD